MRIIRCAGSKTSYTNMIPVWQHFDFNNFPTLGTHALPVSFSRLLWPDMLTDYASKDLENNDEYLNLQIINCN